MNTSKETDRKHLISNQALLYDPQIHEKWNKLEGIATQRSEVLYSQRPAVWLENSTP